MNFKSILVGSLVIMLALTAMVAMFPAGSSNPIFSAKQNLINEAFNGTVTINADGSLSIAGAPIVHQGNYYNLTGNINGTLIIKHNGTIFNGHGYTLFNNTHSSVFYMVNISDSNSVSLVNLNVNSTNAAFGIMIYNSSHDILNNITVTASGISLYAANYTTDLKVSNSIFNTSDLFTPLGNVFLGLYFSGSSIGLPSPNSNDFTLNNDTFISTGGFADLLVGGANSTVSHSYFADNNDQTSIGLGGNNTVIMGNHFNVSQASAIVTASTAFGGKLENITINGNTITANHVSSGFHGIQSAGSGSISHNTININASLVTVTGIYAIAENTTINGNAINITYGGSSPNANVGILTQGSNYTVSDNMISISGGEVTGLLELGNGPVSKFLTVTGNNINEMATYGTGLDFSLTLVDKSTIYSNVLNFNGTLGQGILFTGSNDSVSKNQIIMNQTETSNSAISTGIGEISGTQYSNDLISSNLLKLSGTKGGLQVHAIYLQGFTGLNDTITENNIEDAQITINTHAINVQGISNVLISYNLIHLAGGYQAIDIIQSSNAVFEGNNLTGGSGSGSTVAAVEVSLSSKVQILNNSFSNFNITFSTNLVNRLTVVGNFVQNTSQYILLSDADSNMTFYHNNFLNYTGILQITPPDTNVTFNSSLPLGGNYWDKYTGTDGNGDGIGDTPYSLGSGYSDNYPLMKKWTRPQAIFTESGLYSGMSWSVTFNGVTKTSHGSTISFDILNATYQSYSYQIKEVSGFKLVSQSTGSYNYNGTGSETSVQYDAPFTFTLSETGLPTGTPWILVVNGTSHVIAGNNFTITGYSGTTFNYTVNNSTFYYSSLNSGSYTLSGTNQTLDIVFTHYSYIVGEVPNTGFTLYVNGVKENISSGSFNLTITRGFYEIVAKGPAGTIYDNVTIQPDQTVNITSLFKTTQSGFSSKDIYYAGGAAVAVIAVGSIAYFMRKRTSGR